MYAEAGWARIAALAPCVVSCAQSGDSVAQYILEEGCSDLAHTVGAVVKQLHMTQPFKLVLAGVLRLMPHKLQQVFRCKCVVLCTALKALQAQFVQLIPQSLRS